MDFSLYNLVVNQLSETPDLSTVQNRQPVPETWPVVLTDIVMHRTHLEHFIVSDGKHHVVCVAVIPETQNRILPMEAGTIIHLIGAEVRFNDIHKCYVLEIQDVYTLKEYDDRVKREEQEKADRIA